MLFSNDGDKVEISWSFDGDYIVVVDAKVNGFHGTADGHVVPSEFERFAIGITELAESRKGNAHFSTALPGLLDISVRSTDNTGHLGVFGSLTSASDANSDEVQKLQFSLFFDPSQIEGAARSISVLAR